MSVSKSRFLCGVFGLITLAVVSLTANHQAFGQTATPTATPIPTERILWNFDSIDGAKPAAGLIVDRKGNLYSTTSEGGAYGYGTVFELTPPPTVGGSWTESVLWSFNGSDGREPLAGLIADKSGNFYGTTIEGGGYSQPVGGGTVFELTPPPTAGGSWTESILWSFGSGGDGSYPFAGVIMDKSGNLYGTTGDGGTYGSGTVFELTPPSTVGGSWTESILWNFGNGSDGQNPAAGVIMDKSGNLYGTTFMGGIYQGPFDTSWGTVFKLTPPSISGGNWTESILWNFGNFGDGQNPAAGVIMDARGNLYGTTELGGNYGVNFPGLPADGGTVFELIPPPTGGGDWSESLLWDFAQGEDGANPGAGVIMDARGNLYGTTELGGAYGRGDFVVGGTVFELTPPQTGGSESILWSFFSSDTDGYQPSGGLLMDTNGNLYGTTTLGGTSPDAAAGTVFEISNIPATIVVSPTTLLFPKTAIGSTSTAGLVVRNSGTGQLIGTVHTPPAPFGLNGSGRFNLAPNGQTTITLTFSPTSTGIFRNVDTVAGPNSIVQFKLQGTGSAVP
jgi:uncharacterized repeat protein (TIGR03803 family)